MELNLIKDKDYILHFENLEQLNKKGVYLIRNLDNKLLKIGSTNNLNQRLKLLYGAFRSCGIFANLKVECFIEYEDYESLEKQLHKLLRESNFTNEWFKIEHIDEVLSRLYYCVNLKKNKTIDKNYDKQLKENEFYFFTLPIFKMQNKKVRKYELYSKRNFTPEYIFGAVKNIMDDNIYYRIADYCNVQITNEEIIRFKDKHKILELFKNDDIECIVQLKNGEFEDYKEFFEGV
jgi:hypothetical protein